MTDVETFHAQTAVLWMGLVTGQYERCMARAHELLPFTHFYGHWVGRDAPPIDDYYSFEEPAPHYLPMRDVPASLNPNRKIWMEYSYPIYQNQGLIENGKYSTHQILGHYLLLQQIPKHYKYIIRMRYDVMLSDKIDWVHLMDYVYHHDYVLGFHHVPKFDKKEVYKDELLEVTKDNQWYLKIYDRDYFLYDFIIMYQRWRLDAVNVMSLYDNKKLLGEEFGWAQVLCNTHLNTTKKNLFGGAQITRDKKFMADVE